MKTLIELFNICNNRQDYITVKATQEKFKRYEVDYKFIEEDDVLYIFFEPSDGRVDWRVNFSYWRKPYKDMEIEYRVHGGFLESWKLIHDQVRFKIVEKKAEGGFKFNKIVSVGYSHGGPLAALCHECAWFERKDLRDKDGALVGINFDGPRMYAGLWIKEELKERWRNFYNFRNHSDLVTHLPPVFFLFRHVGEKVMIGVGDNPGLIKAHYPEEIRKGLEDFVKNGEMKLREKIASVLKYASEVAEKVRDFDAGDACDIFNKVMDHIEKK